MVAAVSTVVSQVSDSTAERESASYHWFKMPDLNRATHRRLGQSGAGWTFETICRLVHHVGRVGRPQARKAAKELGRLGVGLQAIADEAGVSVAKVRRDLVKLVDLGLVAVSRRNVTFQVDIATGKIVENRKGRSLPVLVFLTIGPEHGRTKEGTAEPAANHPRMAPSNPVTVAGPGLPDRDHSGGAIQRERNTERTPAVDAVGIGTPPAEQEAGLPAGEAGGHPAAKAGQEGGIIPVNAAGDDLPPSVGRISRPAAKASTPRQAGRQRFPEDRQEPQTWSGEAEAARRRMLAEMEERRRHDAAVIEAEKAAGTLTPRQRAMYFGKAVNS
jgi:hypothetical protein